MHPLCYSNFMEYWLLSNLLFQRDTKFHTFLSKEKVAHILLVQKFDSEIY